MSKGGYDKVLKEVVELLESARRTSARAVNSVMTASYWEVGRRIVELEQGGEARAQYGEQIIERFPDHLTARFGRGFSRPNIQKMRAFFLLFKPNRIRSTVSSKSSKTLISAPTFPLPWSHYARLLQVESAHGRKFYEAEALRNGWSYRQLDRQIGSQFYERTALSRNKVSMLKKGAKRKSGDIPLPEEEIKDPFVLEFLGLKDEYSESDLEEALILKLEHFLLELGGDFAFIGRQRRLRIGNTWYRVDLLFFHRRLRCLVVVDLKIGSFTHADAGQMHLYLNYAKEHFPRPTISLDT